MITERQEQIENGIEVLDHAMYYLSDDSLPVAFNDLANILAIRIMARAKSELQAEFNEVTVKSQNNSCNASRGCVRLVID